MVAMGLGEIHPAGVIVERGIKQQTSWWRRFAAECRRCAQDPLRPWIKLVYWHTTRVDEARAVRELSWVWRVLSFRDRRQRLANYARLGAEFGWSQAQCLEAERAHMKYLARLNIHLMRLARYTPEQLFKSTSVSGESNVQVGLASGRGLMLVLAHSGMWWHAPSLLVCFGYPVHVIANPNLPPRVKRYLCTMSERYGARVSFVGKGAYDRAREAFKSGEVVIVAVDRSLRGDRSVLVPMGNTALPMDPGPAILALRQRVPVIWTDTYYDETGRSCVDFSAPLAIGPGTGRSGPEAVMRYWAELIYRLLRRHPEQWWSASFCSLGAKQELESPTQTIPK